LAFIADLYSICIKRARDRLRNNSQLRRSASSECVDDATNAVVNRESTLDLIHLDVQRTFPTLGIFQPGGPYFDLLLDLLCAYVCYRPDVGYVCLDIRH
jgi:hypothetical protein